MAELKKVPVQKTFFDLDTFADVTVKKFFDFQPVDSIQEALTRLGNKSDRLLKIVNDGLISEQRAAETANPEGWHSLTDEGEMNGAFVGTPADSKAVNTLVLNLAKSSIAYTMGLTWDGATKEQKAAIRAKTVEFIQGTPVIRDGLKQSAALKVEEDEETAGA